MMKSKTDLHIHTKYSDGTLDIEDIFRYAKTEGIENISVTDHDTLDSCYAIRESEKSRHITKDFFYFPGIELSCKHKDIDLHLLGYGIDIDNNHMKDLTAKAKQNRRDKTVRLIKYIHDAHGIMLPEEDIQSLVQSDNNVGKPNFARILIKMGYGSGVSEVIDKYLNEFKAFDLKIEAKEAIQAIREAAGFSVLAHPLIITEDYGYTYRDIDVLCSELKLAGLDGLEAYYGKHSVKDRAEYRKIAIKHQLMMSGGSDFHGSNKPDIKLGDLGEIDNQALTDIGQFLLEMMQ